MAIPSLTKKVDENDDPVIQEEEHVHTIYNQIASHFSQTRYKPWPIVEKFLMGQADFSIGIDVGCGNGKYLGVNPNLFIIGTDRSDGLIECGHEISKNGYNLGVADGLALPHPDEKFDFAISIAVIHHFTTDERRIQAVQHILSKIRVGGKALIYCWALEQEKSRRGYKEGDDQDVLIPWVLQKKQKKEPKEKKGRRDGKRNKEGCQTPKEPVTEQQNPEATEKTNEESEVRYRYYHLYREGELAENSERAGNCKIVEEGYEKDNWWIILERT